MMKRIVELRVKRYPLIIIDINTAETFAEFDIQLFGRISFTIAYWKQRLN